MNKGEIKELYSVMFSEYPDIVTIEDRLYSIKTPRRIFPSGFNYYPLRSFLHKQLENERIYTACLTACSY